MICNARAAA